MPASAEGQEALFNVHRVGEKLLFEIQDGALGRNMVVMCRFVRAYTALVDGAT